MKQPTFSYVFLLLTACVHLSAQKTVPTIWGALEINDPLTEELIDGAAMQRIQGVSHMGPLMFAHPEIAAMNRYDHCVGVYALLKRFGASHQEQLCGLFHDASHSAFSHLADFVFADHLDTFSEESKSYQDKIHLESLRRQGVADIMRRHGADFTWLDTENPAYTMLEQELPDLCADRIEYGLHVGLVTAHFTPQDVIAITDALAFEDGKWIFTDLALAKQFSKASIQVSENYYSSPVNTAIYNLYAKILKLAFAKNICTKRDFELGHDQGILDKLNQSGDPEILRLMAQGDTIRTQFIVTSVELGDIKMYPKNRGVDPLVKHDGQLKRLTELDQDYKNMYEKTVLRSKTGYGITFINSDLPMSAPTWIERLTLGIKNIFDAVCERLHLA